ncbi:tRNA (adenine(22)-N(1))-methyltransferase [Paenibacillus silviterrae]|uniref:tRNA (adenine(22)-N(1))-methyltransferase n=1 Tax=Paenibacillus silviterrae TaxID=3242194 RepID=UPI002543A46B|nr:tRNA (adenine(22)-N(1))-methyltransferase TrmK [Paenibacillus chinjuensis]
MLRLSKRLECIARQVPDGSRMADIGSDHALLPSWLAERGSITFAVAGEVNEGPRDAALRQVKAAGLQKLIDVRLGDGLEVIEPGEVDVITIAGMGGTLIASILEAGAAKLEGVRRLVLQPNVGEDNVRRWLVQHGWVLIQEQILEEDGKIYEILTAVPESAADITNLKLYEPFQLGENVKLSENRLLLMGPYLVREGSPVLIKKWEAEIKKLQMIERQLGQSDNPASREKERELQEEMHAIREVLACLPKVKPSFS